MKIVLDFNYDKDVIDLYHESLQNEFTTEFRFRPEVKITRELTENRLLLIKRNYEKSGYKLHGILKVYIDNKLAAISFPRPLVDREYDTYNLPATKEYHRLGGIFINPEFRGQGIAGKLAEWLIDKYKNILWTADVSNSSSNKVATKQGLKFIKTHDVKNPNTGETVYSLNVYTN